MISTSSIVHTKSKSTITFDINIFKNFLSSNGKILSLDASKRMIGTALSDDRKKIALSHILIERKKLSKDLDEIKIIAEIGWNHMGNISLAMPSIHPMLDINAGEAVNHQPEYAAATIKPGGHKAIFDGAYGMGATIIDLAEKNLWDNL